MLDILELSLDNGIPVILIPMQGFYSYVQICAVRGGSRYETKEVNGISHFLEHMLFKGTKKRPTMHQIAVELEMLGASSNAFTSEEHIAFYVSEPGRFFRQVTDILSDQLINYVFELDEVAKEKNVVLEELQMGQSNPQGTAFGLIPRLMYGDQAAGLTVIGTEKVLNQITRDQLIEYTQKYFVRNNMAIVVAGNLPKSEVVLSMLNEYYDAVPVGDAPVRLPTNELFKIESSIAIKEFNAPQTSFVLAMPSPNLDSDDLYAVAILSTILGEGISSRLSLEVREKRGLVYDISSYITTHSDASKLMVYGGTRPKNIFEVLSIIGRQFSDLATNLVSSEELIKAKHIQEAQMLRSLEHPYNVAFSVVPDYMSLGKVERPNITLEKIKAVTAEDVQRVAQEIFINPNLHLAVVGKHKSKEEKTFRKSITF